MASPNEALSERDDKTHESVSNDAPFQPKPKTELRFVAIRPKPPEPPKPAKLPTAIRLRPPRSRTDSSHRRCPVPICKRLDCRLQTHKDYGRYRLEAARRSQISKRSRTPSPLPQGDISGLPELPLGEDQPDIYRALFNNFFRKIYDRVLILLSPPPFSPEQKSKAADLKKAMLRRSLETPVYCLNYVASALIAQRMSSHDHDTVVLYGKVMKLLREKLATFTTDEVDHLLVVILTLVLLDIAVNNYNNLHVHRAGMTLLVNSRGGIHNLNASLMYTVNLDRIIAIYAAKPPLYAPRMDRAIQRPNRFEQTYGTFFDSPSARTADLPDELVVYCRDLCRTIELFEGQGISFDPNNVSEGTSIDLHYFYFLRNRLANEFVYLNAAYAETHGIVRCILLAAKIVDYLCLTDNYIAAIPVFLAKKIRECLDLQDFEVEWAGLEAALRWVQWTMACVHEVGEYAHQETLTFLVDRAETMYRQMPFPLDWNEQGLQFSCVRNFVWASSLDERLTRVCDEEDKLLRPRLEIGTNISIGSTTQPRPTHKGKGKVK